VRLFVSGGAGFIGANFIRAVLAEQPDVQITNFDALTYAGTQASLAGLDGHPSRVVVAATAGVSAPRPTSSSRAFPDGPGRLCIMMI
jgi:dTDP-D-glucose 4,6-dehydratase